MTYVIAEIGNNHNGDIDKCLHLVEKAADTGADAVKVQSFRGLDIIAPNVLASEYEEWDSGDNKYWYQFLDTIALPLEDHQRVIDFAKELNLDFITTPVSSEIVGYLEEMRGIAAYKVASMDLTNFGLLQTLAKTKKPIIMSTGMGSIEEIIKAAEVFRDSDLSILHCVSDYPLDPTNASLTNISYLKEKFESRKIGFSDHSLGHELSLAAVGLGAEIIEKHFTVNRKDPNPAEHHMSMEPHEFKLMVDWIRDIGVNLQKKEWNRSNDESINKKIFRRSFHYKRPIKVGETLSLEDLVFIRPGNGIEYDKIEKVLNKKITKSKEAYDPCLLEDFK